MPDITDLLSGAAPEPPPFDEDDVRRRVHRRRRNRRALAGVAAVVALVAAYGIVLATHRTDERVSVSSDETTTPSSTAPPSSAPRFTAVAIVGGDVWAGGDGFVSLGDGSDRIDVPGTVQSLAVGDVLWVRGDTWVVAIDTAAKNVVGTWRGGRTGDVEALPSREAAISLPDTDEVAIVKTSAIAELEEVWRIPVRTAPRDLVRTTGGDVWVTCGDGISELDVGAQGVKRFERWRGPLLAPSRSGGIWTVDGDRIIDLHPENLDAGLSVAEGTRYQAQATAVTETSFGLYVAGPQGLLRFDSNHTDPEVLWHDSEGKGPAALAADGGQVAYVVDGAIRTGMAHG